MAANQFGSEAADERRIKEEQQGAPLIGQQEAISVTLEGTILQKFPWILAKRSRNFPVDLP